MVTFVALCPKGYASETGLAHFVSSPPMRRPSGCQPCPSGYFQEIEGQRYCRGCPNKAKSRNDREATVSVFECDGITRINWDAEVVIIYFLKNTFCMPKSKQKVIKYSKLNVVVVMCHLTYITCIIIKNSARDRTIKT